ncbi:MAG: 6,7-dimethyl-8-ribityllumazine synthase [Gemmatimonadota bacterium]
MTEFRGRPSGSGRRLCLVVSRFNQIVTSRLEEEARAELQRRGVGEDEIDVVHVPGAWELTSGVRRALGRGYDGIVALGCLVRGETPHFDVLCRAVGAGLIGLAREHDTPIAFGVLTTETLAQALERAGGEAGNQGASAAAAALEMCDLLDRLS